tara:strand:+ start:625 stop:1818 length:1194 start_codon:yes stop_codon:yes gene_type:complete
MNFFDVVVIGSSPAALLEAAYWQSRGKNTCIIERGRIGGNWKFCSMFGYENIEIGPHIFFGHKNGFKFLEKLGMKIYKSSILNFDVHEKKVYKNLYLLRHFFFSNFKNLSFSSSKIIELFNILKNEFKDFIINRVGYLEGGCHELLSSILGLKIFEKITFFHDSCTKIRFEDDRIFLTLGNGVIECRKVITTQSSDIDYLDICFNQRYISEAKISINKLNSAQVTIIAKNINKKINFTKVQLSSQCKAGTTNLTNNKKKIKYISDITHIIKNQNRMCDFSSDIQVLSLAVDADSYDLRSSNPNISKLFGDLKNMKIIDDNSEFIDFNVFIVEAKVVTPESVKNVNSFFGGKITCLLTDSLIDAIADKYHEYNQTIDIQKKAINKNDSSNEKLELYSG